MLITLFGLVDGVELACLLEEVLVGVTSDKFLIPTRLKIWANSHGV